MISRSTLIGALVVVELAIVGMAAKAVAGGPPGGSLGFGVPMFGGHLVESATPLDRTFAPGPAPHVVVDVHDVHVIVETGNVATVHAVETLSKSGYLSGTIPEMTAQQTLDGVHIRTSGDSSVVAFGSFDREVRITVPPAAQVEIASAERIDVSGLRAKLVAHIVEGPIYVSDHRGDLDLSCSDGRIVLNDVQGADIAANTRDGRLMFRRVAAERIDAASNDGRIEAVDVHAVDGALTTHDGRVDVSFTGDSDATVDVRTGDGKVHVHGLTTTDDGDGSSVVHLGSGRGHFEVATNDGSIYITRGANTHA
jgi:hypothetical protein